MAITKWDPFPDLTSFRDQFDRLWPSAPWGRGQRENWLPAVDVFDNEDAVVLKAELAGMTPDDIKIEVDNNVLTIRGERKFEDKVDEDRYCRVERRFGSFERSISLPQGAKADDIQAAYEDGILEVRVPKVEAKKPERVEIKVAPVKKEQAT